MRERIDPTLYSYARSALVIREVTKGITKEPVPERVVDSWITTFVVLFLADEKIDNLPSVEDRRAFVSQSISFLEGSTEEFRGDDNILSRSMHQLRDDLDLLASERKGYFMGNLRKLCAVTERIRTTEDPQEYSSLTSLEGQLTSRLPLAFLPEEYAQDKVEKLESAMVSLGTSGNLIDTSFDLGRDYANGETKIRPTLENRGILFRGAMGEVRNFIREAGPVSTIKASVLLARILAVNFIHKAQSKLAVSS